MTDKDWDQAPAGALGLLLNGDAIHTRDDHGEPVVDDTFIVLFNAHQEPIDWALPEDWADKQGWEVVVQTAGTPAASGPAEAGQAGRSVATGKTTVAARSLLVLRLARTTTALTAT